MKFKKFIPSLMLCGLLSLGAGTVMACSVPVDPDKSLKEAYNVYISTTADDVELSFEQWLEKIKAPLQKSDDDIKTAYTAYTNVMTGAQKTPLSYADWLIYIASVPTDGDRDLKVAYNEYSLAMSTAGKVALSYTDWVSEIKQASADPIDPDQNLNAAYLAYKADCQSLGKIPLPKSQWEDKIKAYIAPAIDPDQNLKATYQQYYNAMILAAKTPLTYDEWLVEIKKAPADPESALKLAYSEYALAMINANKDALTYDDWVSSIKQVPVSSDEGLLNAYDAYVLAMQNAEKTALPFGNWLEEIKKAPADPVDPNEELHSAYESYKSNMQTAGKIALSYENWVVEIKKASPDPIDPDQNLKVAYNQYVITMQGFDKVPLTLTQWKDYIVQDSTAIDPDQNLKAKYNEYKTNMELAGKGTSVLSYEEWKAYISQDNPLNVAYNTYVSAMNDALKTPESYNVWFERIQSVHNPVTTDGVIDDLFSQYQTNGGTMEKDEWKELITSASLGETSGDNNSATSINTYYQQYQDNGGTLSKDAWLIKIVESTLGSTSTGSTTSPIAQILQDTYDAYKKAATLPCDYETFVDYLFEKQPTAVSYTVNADGTVSCKLSNNTTKKVTLPLKYVVKAVDENENPLANVYVGLSYYHSDSYTTYEPTYGITDKNGECVLLFDYELAYNSYKEYNTENGNTSLSKANWTTFIKTATFNAQLSNIAANEGFELMPNGYVLDLGVDELWGWTLNSIPFENGEATLTFDERKSDFNNTIATNIKYTRVWNDSTQQIETNSRFVAVVLEAGVYQYLSFNPYVSPEYIEDNETAYNLAIDNAKNAAKGIYAITVMSDAKPTMYHYSSTAQLNSDGIPESVMFITGTAPVGTSEEDLIKYTGTNSINVHYNTEQLGSTQTFGLVCNEDCVVIIQVERIGDANERIIEEIDYTPESVSLATVESGTPTLVPVDGTAIPVYNEEDGYYHLGSKTGKILYIDLSNKVSRVNPDYAIKDYTKIVLPGGTSAVGDSIFTYSLRQDNQYLNSYKTIKHVFGGLVKAYANKVNADGLYPVTQDVYQFIQFFKSNCYAYSETPAEYTWLLPCKYYA